MSRIRAPGRRVESYYESFIGVPRAREDREECRSSSCTGELIASRSLTLRGAHGTDDARGSLRGGSLRRLRRGHAAEKIPRITMGPGMRARIGQRIFFSREHYCAQRCVEGSDQRANVWVRKSAINI